MTYANPLVGGHLGGVVTSAGLGGHLGGVVTSAGLGGVYSSAGLATSSIHGHPAIVGSGLRYAITFIKLKSFLEQMARMYAIQYFQ